MHYLTLLSIPALLSLLAASSPIPNWEKIEKRQVGALNTTAVANTTASASPSPTATAEDENFIYLYDPSEDSDVDAKDEGEDEQFIYLYDPIEDSEVANKRKDIHTKTIKDEDENLYDPKLDKNPAAKDTKAVSKHSLKSRGTEKDEDEDFIYFYDPKLDTSDKKNAKAISKHTPKSNHTRNAHDEDVDYIYLYDPVAAGEDAKNIQKHQRQQ